MAGAIVCDSCGGKIKEGRTTCPRCGGASVSAETAPGQPGTKSSWFRGGPVLLAGAALSVIAMLVLVSFLRQPVAPVTSVPLQTQQTASPEPAASLSDRVAAPPILLTEPRTSADSSRAASAAYAQGNFALALEQFERAVSQQPDDAQALNNLGQVLVRVGRTREALPLFIRAIELTPSEWAPRFNLAHAYGVLGDWARAIPEYKRAAELFPGDYVTHYNLGLAHHKAGQEEAAVGEFQRAIALAPSEPSFLLSLGISYEALKRPGDAAQAYEDYLALAPTAPDAAKIKTRIEALRKPAQG
jgi:Flp pilus assembly protein TadD